MLHTNVQQLLQKHVEAISLASNPGIGMDILIVVTNNKQQQRYWQGRLSFSNSKVIVVEEDWPGGAGNALGTLYAYQKACVDAKKRYGINLLEQQKAGAAVAMYHTAGQGTRLAPLPGSESNNKSAVKLPCQHRNSSELVTILEAVIQQTAIFAPTRGGRLSVFWGDQIFVPSLTPKDSFSPASILASVAPMPTREQWIAKGLSRYGLVAIAKDGSAKQLEKLDYDTLLKLVDDGILSNEDHFGTSLGSFSISYDLLKTFLDEFSSELTSKKGKLDSDPHWWMALTLDKETYVHVMEAKGVDRMSAERHHNRMQALDIEQPILTALDVGQELYWWDFGTIRSYYDSCMKMTLDTPEGMAIRTFFGAELDETNSIVIGSHINQPHLHNSVIVDVNAEQLNTHSSVIIHSSFRDATCNHCLLYNVEEPNNLQFPSETVRADVNDCKMITHLDSNGSKDWNTRLAENPVSYAELYKINESR